MQANNLSAHNLIPTTMWHVQRFGPVGPSSDIQCLTYHFSVMQAMEGWAGPGNEANITVYFEISWTVYHSILPTATVLSFSCKKLILKHELVRVKNVMCTSCEKSHQLSA